MILRIATFKHNALSIMTQCKMAHFVMTHSIFAHFMMTQCKMIHIIMTLSITTFSITPLSADARDIYAECFYDSVSSCKMFLY